MEPYLLTSIKLLLVFLLVLANALFVAAEFAIVRSRKTKLRSPEHRRKLGWKLAFKLINDLELSLSSTQLGITIASLLLGWWGEQSIAGFLIHTFEGFGDPLASIMSHTVAVIISLIVITFLHVVVGELAAKSIAIRYPETTLRVCAAPMYLFTWVCKPLIFFLNGAANILLKIFGLDSVAESERVHTSAELAMLVSHSTEKGELDKDEEKMLKGVFGFSETVAREVMTPRTDLVTISEDSTLEEIMNIIVESGYSRLPVKGETIDDIQGVLLARDLLPFIKSRINTDVKDFKVKDLMRQPYFIPETKPIDDLLNEIKQRKIHMAVVLDEHGGVDGVVTLEDLIEEIVGEIFDESDIAEEEITVEDNGDAILDGSVLVADVNSQFSLPLPEGDYDTIGGFVFNYLGRIPERGDRVAICAKGQIFVNDEPVDEVSLEDVVDEEGEEDTVSTETDEVSSEQEFLAIFSVEEVANNRIERIRLRHCANLSNLEPKSLALASEKKAVSSE